MLRLRKNITYSLPFFSWFFSSFLPLIVEFFSSLQALKTPQMEQCESEKKALSRPHNDNNNLW